MNIHHELDWPSLPRAGKHELAAHRVAVLGAEFSEAYRLAAWVGESELSDGRGDRGLHLAATEFCDALYRHAGMP